MKIETFTLRSNDTGGVAALRQVHPADRISLPSFPG